MKMKLKSCCTRSTLILILRYPEFVFIIDWMFDVDALLRCGSRRKIETARTVSLWFAEKDRDSTHCFVVVRGERSWQHALLRCGSRRKIVTARTASLWFAEKDRDSTHCFVVVRGERSWQHALKFVVVRGERSWQHALLRCGSRRKIVTARTASLWFAEKDRDSTHWSSLWFAEKDCDSTHCSVVARGERSWQHALLRCGLRRKIVTAPTASLWFAEKDRDNVTKDTSIITRKGGKIYMLNEWW